MWDCNDMEEFPLGICTPEALEKLSCYGWRSLKWILLEIGQLWSLNKIGQLWNLNWTINSRCGNVMPHMTFLLEHAISKCCKNQLFIDVCLWGNYKRNMMLLKYAFSKPWRIYHLMEAWSLRIIPKGYGFTYLKKLECEIWEDFSSRVSTLNALEEL